MEEVVIGSSLEVVIGSSLEAVIDSSLEVAINDLLEVVVINDSLEAAIDDSLKAAINDSLEEAIDEISPSDELPISPGDELPILPSDELLISPLDKLLISPSDELPISPLDELLSPSDELLSPSDELLSPSDELPISPSDELPILPSDELPIKNNKLKNRNSRVKYRERRKKKNSLAAALVCPQACDGALPPMTAMIFPPIALDAVTDKVEVLAAQVEWLRSELSDAIARIEKEAGVARAKAVEEEEAEILVINDVDVSKKCKEAGGVQDSIDVDDDDDDCVDVVVSLTESPHDDGSRSCLALQKAGNPTSEAWANHKRCAREAEEADNVLQKRISKVEKMIGVNEVRQDARRRDDRQQDDRRQDDRRRDDRRRDDRRRDDRRRNDRQRDDRRRNDRRRDDRQRDDRRDYDRRQDDPHRRERRDYDRRQDDHHRRRKLWRLPMAPIVAAVDYNAAARLALIVEVEAGMASAKAVEEEDAVGK
jgi:hypothetical protein